MKKNLILVALVSGLVASSLTVFAQGALKKFPDVDYKAYYGDAVTWANSNTNIVNGYDNGKFGPNDAVTRAQLVTILKRYDDQLVNAWRMGNIGKLQNLLCTTINKKDLPSNDPSYGNIQKVWDEVCIGS